MSQPLRVIVDVDAGLDDAWALFLLIRAHQNPDVNLRIEAITMVNGNTPLENVVVNVTRVLNAANESEIPIFRGATTAMVVPFIRKRPPYHGEDGFGDADLPPVVPIVEPEHAVAKLIAMARAHEGELTVLALGPLTNLALAINHAPDIHDAFSRLVILGGNHEGYGNVATAAEFNFYADAEAARTVLERYTCPMVVVPEETWERYGTSTHEFRVDVLGVLETSQIWLMNQAEAKILDDNRETWQVPDAVAAAVLLDSRVVTKTESQYCAVELNGSLSRGMMVVDRRGRLEKPPNVELITEVDKELYEKMLVTAAGGEWYEP